MLHSLKIIIMIVLKNQTNLIQIILLLRRHAILHLHNHVHQQTFLKPSQSFQYASPIPPSRKEKYCIKDFPLFLPVGVCQNSKLSQIFLTYSSQWFHLSQNFILLSQIISDVIWKDWFVSKFDFSKIWFISSVRFIISRLWLRSSNN